MIICVYHSLSKQNRLWFFCYHYFFIKLKKRFFFIKTKRRFNHISNGPMRVVVLFLLVCLAWGLDVIASLLSLRMVPAHIDDCVMSGDGFLVTTREWVVAIRAVCFSGTAFLTAFYFALNELGENNARRYITLWNVTFVYYFIAQRGLLLAAYALLVVRTMEQESCKPVFNTYWPCIVLYGIQWFCWLLCWQLSAALYRDTNKLECDKPLLENDDTRLTVVVTQ